MDDVGVFLLYSLGLNSPMVNMMGSFVDVKMGVKNLEYKSLLRFISLLELVQD